MADERQKLTDQQKAAYVILEALSPETAGGGRAWVGARAVGNVYRDGAGAKWAGPKLKALVKAGYAERNDKREYRPAGSTPEWARVPEPPAEPRPPQPMERGRRESDAATVQAMAAMSEPARRQMNRINQFFGGIAEADRLNVLFAAVMRKVGAVQLTSDDLLGVGDEFLVERVFQWVELATGELVLKSFPHHPTTNTVYLAYADDIPELVQETMKANGFSIVVAKPS